jgi:transposase-like protein
MSKSKIEMKTRLEAIHDYLRSGDSLRIVGERHGMSSETLRRFLGDAVRPKDKNGKAKFTGKTRPSVVAKQNIGILNQNKRWGKIEDETLIDAVRGGMTVEETSELLGRTPAAVYTRKHNLVRKGALGERFVIPEGIKRTRRPVMPELFDEAPVVEAPVVETPVVEPTPTPMGEVTEVNLKEISLERLAGIVRKYSVNLTMNISGGVTTIQMEKR